MYVYIFYSTPPPLLYLLSFPFIWSQLCPRLTPALVASHSSSFSTSNPYSCLFALVVDSHSRPLFRRTSDFALRVCVCVCVLEILIAALVHSAWKKCQSLNNCKHWFSLCIRLYLLRAGCNLGLPTVVLIIMIIIVVVPFSMFIFFSRSLSFYLLYTSHPICALYSPLTVVMTLLWPSLVFYCYCRDVGLG